MLSSFLVKDNHCERCLPASSANAVNNAKMVIRSQTATITEYLDPCYLERKRNVYEAPKLQDILYLFIHTNLCKITEVIYRSCKGNLKSREIRDFTKTRCSIKNLEIPQTCKNTLLYNLSACHIHNDINLRPSQLETTTRYTFQPGPNIKKYIQKLNPGISTKLYNKYHTAPNAILIQAKLRCLSRKNLPKNFLRPIKTVLYDYTVVHKKYKFKLILTAHPPPQEQKPPILSKNHKSD